MSITSFPYKLSSQNQRVTEYAIAGDEQPKNFSAEGSAASVEINDLIEAAYRQIFNEQQLLISNRQYALESQLRFGIINVREFVRGLVMSETFRLRNFDTNNNYRFVEMCVQKLLGRKVYNHQETLSLSILIPTKGLSGFIDTLMDSDEYQTNFGDYTVPYQRRRHASEKGLGEIPFTQFPRYDGYYREQLKQLGYFKHKPAFTYLWEWQNNPPKALEQLWLAIIALGTLTLFALILAVFLGI